MLVFLRHFFAAVNYFASDVDSLETSLGSSVKSNILRTCSLDGGQRFKSFPIPLEYLLVCVRQSDFLQRKCWGVICFTYIMRVQLKLLGSGLLKFNILSYAILQHLYIVKAISWHFKTLFSISSRSNISRHWRTLLLCEAASVTGGEGEQTCARS